MGVVPPGTRARVGGGGGYARVFTAVSPAVARAQGVPLYANLLEGVARNPSLNQPDGIHPTAEGHKIVAETVWRALQPLL